MCQNRPIGNLRSSIRSADNPYHPRYGSHIRRQSRYICATENVSSTSAYDEWTAINREKLSLYHEKETPPVPLEDNKEFRSIKNEIIKYAAELAETPEAQLSSVYHRSSLWMLAVTLAKLISASYDKRRQKLQSQIDGRLRAKIEQKKATQGIKTDFSVQDEGWGLTM